MIENPTTFYIARHGQTDWNTRGLVQGHTDIPLNETGIAQAHKLREKFKDIPLDKIFSSDLLRARQTAEIIALEKELVVETTRALREGTMGIFEGSESDPFFEMLHAWRDQSEEEKADHERATDLIGVETPDSMVERLFNFLKETTDKYTGKKILIVTHGGLIRNSLTRLGFERITKATNGSIITLESDGNGFSVIDTEGIEGI